MNITETNHNKIKLPKDNLECLYNEVKILYKYIIKTDEQLVIPHVNKSQRLNIYFLIENKYQNLSHFKINLKDGIADVIISIYKQSQDNESIIIDNTFKKIMNIKSKLILSKINLTYLDKIYPKIKEKYIEFKNFIETEFNNINEYIIYEKEVMNNAKNFLQSFKNVIKNSEKVIDPCLVKYKQDMSNISNCNEDYSYLRMDIIKANFTAFLNILQDNDILKQFFLDNKICSDITINKYIYEDFINCFNYKKDPFITNSKIFRQVLFGDLSIYLEKNQNLIIKTMFKIINHPLIEKTIVYNDALIFKFKTKDTPDVEIYSLINYVKEMCHLKFPSIFKIDLYKLRYYNLQLNNKKILKIFQEINYELENYNKIIKFFTFKSFNKEYIIEAIKYVIKETNQKNILQEQEYTILNTNDNNSEFNSESNYEVKMEELDKIITSSKSFKQKNNILDIIGNFLYKFCS